CTELAEKWNDSRDCADNIMRCESDDRVLNRIFRRTHIFFRLMGNLFSSLPVQRNPQASVFIEAHRVSICKSERCDVLITLCAPDRALADAFDDSLRIFGAAVRTDARDERVARKPAFHRLVMSGSGSN